MGQPCKHMLILTKPIMNLLKLALALLFFTMAPVNCKTIKCCQTACTSELCDTTSGKAVWTYTRDTKDSTAKFVAKQNANPTTAEVGQAEMQAGGKLVCELKCVDASETATYTLSKELPKHCTALRTTTTTTSSEEEKKNNKQQNNKTTKTIKVMV